MECIAHHTIEIEADSFDEAMDKSMNMEIPMDEISIEESLPISADSEDGKHKDY
jgi:hypothetical protein